MAAEKLVSWDPVQVSIRFGDRTFVEPEVKTVEMLLVVGVLKLQEVGGLETSCLVDFVDLWFGSFHLQCLFKLAVLFLKL